MTAQILSSELGNLIQESKRKNPELRNAAEKALEELKSLPVTSEAQFAGDLSRRPNFAAPFTLACATRNAKFTSIGVTCLQRLSVSKSLHKQKVGEVLEALKEASSHGIDIQLKILQALPSLLQNYADQLHGEPLGTALFICSTLQGSKNTIVKNTSSATFQQLVISIYDVLGVEEVESESPNAKVEISAEGKTFQLSTAALDAYRKPDFLKIQGIPPTFGLELIESILGNHPQIFTLHPEQALLLKSRTMPVCIKLFSERAQFPVTVRVCRIFNIVLRRHVEIVPDEAEVAYSLLVTMLDAGFAANWKRVLCMEIFRNVHSDPDLIRSLFALFDATKQRKPIVKDHISSLVRLATEKPAVIGLGAQSTVPSGVSSSKDASGEQAALEAGGVGGMIGGMVTSSETPSSGISAELSSVRSACLDQLDKIDPPTFPDSYLYSLVLTCVNSFSENLAKFVLPLTIPEDSKSKRKRIQNANIDTSDPEQDGSNDRERRSSENASDPLTSESHQYYHELQIVQSMIESCWPAILATCSTFLYASLDTPFYHSLVRSFQRFAHVAGLMKLKTPRDAFLTTLGKAAVPPNSFSKAASITTPTPSSEASNPFGSTRGFLGVENIVSPTSKSSERGRAFSFAAQGPILTSRNLLCLRALLNLAIALGPSLDKAWTIILDTLHQAEYMIQSANKLNSVQPTPSISEQNPDSEQSTSLQANFGSEVVAVHAAVIRMLEATADFADESFVSVLNAFCALLSDTKAFAMDEGDQTRSDSTTLSPRVSTASHQRKSSTSGVTSLPNTMWREDPFALIKLAELIKINIRRLANGDPSMNGWSLLVEELVSISSTGQTSPPIRLRAAEVLHNMISGVASVMQEERHHGDTPVWTRSLLALKTVIRPLLGPDRQISSSAVTTDVEIHQKALETLKDLLEKSTETPQQGWETIDFITHSVFEHDTSHAPGALSQDHVSIRSRKLLRPGFSLVELICSDYLSTLPPRPLLRLINTVARYCRQQFDLNISLTCISMFWNISDTLRSDATLPAFEDLSVLRAETSVDAESADHLDILHLWVIFLLQLRRCATDSRSEVRNGVVRSLVRSLDTFGNILEPQAWSDALDNTLSPILGEFAEQLVVANRATDARATDSTLIQGLSESIAVAIDGALELVGNYMLPLDQSPQFAVCWRSLTTRISESVQLDVPELTSSLFSSLTDLLSKIETSEKLGSEALETLWALWTKDFPFQGYSNTASEHQKALVAHTQCFIELHRLMRGDMSNDKVTEAAGTLFRAVSQADHSPYSADAEYMSPLQKQVIGGIKALRCDVIGAPTTIIKTLGEMVSLPFQKSTLSINRPNQSFAAFSKICMEYLENTILRYVDDEQIYSSGAYRCALDALLKPIDLKYSYTVGSKNMPLWRLATEKAVSILRTCVPVLNGLSSLAPREIERLWKRITKLTVAIVSADVEPELAKDFQSARRASCLEDESFDVESFTELRELITPYLGNSNISDKTRRAYTEGLFYNSIIHEPQEDDLPQTDSELLSHLYFQRPGHTRSKPRRFRVRMSYICLDELVSLVSAQDGVSERVRLAQAAAPYVILRIGISLRAYVADQPLRGRLPQPITERVELLHLLRSVSSLDCEPRSIPDAPGVSTQKKKHLHRLFPLISRAVRVAGNDVEILEELGQIIDIVSDEMGVS